MILYRTAQIVIIWMVLLSAIVHVALGPAPPPSTLAAPKNAPGYCPSSGGSTHYERIQSVTLTRQPSGSWMLVVEVYIANPTGCTPGKPCPEYDNSPEYVNVWIDWNGDKTWDASERVMDKALTGYLAISYFGPMIAVETVTQPASVTNEPTWLRANLGWGHDPNDPCEVSWTWGNVVDQQIHLKTPEIKSITAQGCKWSIDWPWPSCINGTPGNNPQTGSKVRLTADIDIPTGYEITKCSWSGHLTPGEGRADHNCLHEYTPARGPGPSIETYGEKEVTLIVTYRHKASGATGQVSKKHSYKVFFEKNGNDNKGESGDKGPNWFEYWGDDGAVPGLNAPDVKFNETYLCIFIFSICLWCQWGCWGCDGDVITLGQCAGEFHPELSIPSGTNCPGGTFGNDKGIDTAANTLAHERRHQKTFYRNWKEESSNNSCGAADGPWKGCQDSDKSITPDPNEEDYHDALPDQYEQVVGTSPHKVDSCNIASRKGVASYKYYGDNEFDALRAGHGKKGDKSKDWANPGKQANPSFAPSASSQVEEAKLSMKSGPAGPNATYSRFFLVAATTLGSLTGSYSDIGVDTDSDGLYNNLKLSVGVRINEPSSYYVVAWLEDASGTKIAWASTGATLTVGTHTINLLFDGLDIRGSKLNGPYNIARVELREVDTGFLVDAADNAHTTAAYRYTDFDPPNVGFTRSFSDIGVDTNGDGLYNLLRINIGLDVQKAGTYMITGELENSDSLAVASITIPLSSGNQNVALDFDGQLIFQQRENGPYHLTEAPS